MTDVASETHVLPVSFLGGVRAEAGGEKLVEPQVVDGARAGSRPPEPDVSTAASGPVSAKRLRDSVKNKVKFEDYYYITNPSLSDKILLWVKLFWIFLFSQEVAFEANIATFCGMKL